MHNDNYSFFHGKRGEYLVVIQFVVFFGFVFMPSWNPLLGPNTAELLSPVRWGVLIVTWFIALLLAGFGSLHIREYLTPLPFPVDHSQLVQTGVYAWVRHPLYSSQLFAGLGWAAFNLSLSHLMGLIVAYLFFHYKASKEEGWLLERHPEYAEYARRVGKFLPRRSRRGHIA